ncbi:MAG: diphosphomevalonate decarboxylase [Bacteroidia bacterium]|nr:diphosphomevalonate decarboxylase [Bacteroidia bacterium]
MNSAQIKTAWRSPSNIALVKYWGKKGPQLPANPSISFTLDKAYTETEVEVIEKSEEGVSLELFFEKERNPAFESKLLSFLQKAERGFPWLKHQHLVIHSSNTFPHSSGIASSASAFSALVLNLCSIDAVKGGLSDKDFYEKASYWSRIGSVSACRSVYGGFNLWGQTPALNGSSDEFAVNIDDIVHPVFKDFRDTILIVEKGKKAVSSTMGHALLEAHSFADLRYKTGFQNTELLLEILESGDLDGFVKLVEAEALMLHALMMTSPTPFILMKPNTLAVIEKIQDFRNQTGIHLLFTLDAGANVHLLNPGNQDDKVQEFIKNELVGYCQNASYLCNAVGKGPEKVK